MIFQILTYVNNNPECKLDEIASGLNVSIKDIRDDIASMLNKQFLRKKKKTEKNQHGGLTNHQLFSIEPKGLNFLHNSTTIQKKKMSTIKIFISHAYDDRKIAEKIIEKLLVPIFSLSKKDDIFFTSNRKTGIRSSLNWRNKIKSSLIESEIFIALISPNFKKSEMCMNELGAAWISEKKIYPLIVPPVTFNDFSVVIAELQADNILEKEDVFSFMESLKSDLSSLYQVKSDFNDIENQIKKFFISLKSFLRKNPTLFGSNPEELKKIEAKTTQPRERDSDEEIQREIKERSQKQWPEDYEMQEHTIQEQTQAYHDINNLQSSYLKNEDISRIIGRAIKQWPEDYEMQLHTANEQIEAYERLK